MGIRNRLIRPVYAAIYRVDRDTMIAAGMDDVLRAPRVTRPLGALGARKTQRSELAELRVPVQVQAIVVNKQAQGPGGDVPDYRTVLLAHFEWLTVNSLVSADTGEPLIYKGDRIGALYHYRTGALLRKYHNPQVFITEVRDRGHGLDGGRNLVQFWTDDRPQGLEAAP